MGTVIVAMIAIYRQSRDQRGLQQAEWGRAFIREQTFTSVLAISFAKELYRAGIEIQAMCKCLDNLGPGNIASLRAAYANGIDREKLFMIERFSGQLQGFGSMDAVGLLNTVSLWKTEMLFERGFFSSIPDEYLLSSREKFVNHLKGMLTVFRDAQGELRKYVGDLPIEEMTESEIRAANFANTGSV